MSDLEQRLMVQIEALQLQITDAHQKIYCLERRERIIVAYVGGCLPPPVSYSITLASLLAQSDADWEASKIRVLKKEPEMHIGYDEFGPSHPL
jgi:hypothetical protein